MVLNKLPGILAPLLGRSLRAKAMRGGLWLGLGSVAEQGARFGRNMLLARTLGPGVFGTMAIVLASAAVIDTVLEVGIREAIIQNPRGAEREYLNAAWWLALGRGIFLYAIIFAIAPLISSFYGNPILAPIFRVALIAVLLNGALSGGVALALKQMHFSRWAAINHGGGIFGTCVTVLLSFYLRDIWALALGYMADGLGRLLLSYLLCPFVPRLGWDKKAASDLLIFSRRSFGMSLFNLIYSRADVFVLGKLFSPAKLGLYTLAVYLVQTPTVFAINVFGQTFLPLLSEVQDDSQRTNRILCKVTSILLFTGLPIFAFLCFFGKPILCLAYGEEYGQGAAILGLACLVGFINIVNAQLTTVFLASGRPQLHRLSVGIMAAVMIAIIYPFSTSFGLAGGQLACAVSVATGFALQILMIRPLTGLDLRLYGRAFLIPCAVSIVVSAACVSVSQIASLGHIPSLVLGACGCLAAFSASLVLSSQARSAFQEFFMIREIA